MTDHAYIEMAIESSGVAVLTLNNPPLNLNTLATLAELRDACRTLAANDCVRAVVLTGKGAKAFCAGSDVNEFASVRDDVVPRKLARENEAFTALEDLPMPIIAALNGVTLGGGAEIALCCDIRIMDETTRIGFPEVKLGVFPGSGGVFRLPRLIGPSRAYELLYTGELIDAEEARRIGLVNRIAPVGGVCKPRSLWRNPSPKGRLLRSVSFAPACATLLRRPRRRRFGARSPTATRSSPLQTSRKALPHSSANALRSLRRRGQPQPTRRKAISHDVSARRYSDRKSDALFAGAFVRSVSGRSRRGRGEDRADRRRLQRHWSGAKAFLNQDFSVFFLMAGRNQRSIELDIQSDEGNSVLWRLIEKADVLVENFRPGALDKRGFSYDEVRKRNPRIIYCSLTGFGSEGPSAREAGTRSSASVLSGLAMLSGRASDPPVLIGTAIVDQHAATLGALGVVAALLRRERTGLGCKVDSNLLSAGLDLQIEPVNYHLNGAKLYDRSRIRDLVTVPSGALRRV